MTGSEKVVYKLVDLVVKSMDDSVEVELCRVRGKVKTVSRKLNKLHRKGRRPCSMSSFSLRALTFPKLKTKKFEEKTTLSLPLELKTGKVLVGLWLSVQ